MPLLVARSDTTAGAATLSGGGLLTVQELGGSCCEENDLWVCHSCKAWLQTCSVEAVKRTEIFRAEAVKEVPR